MTLHVKSSEVETPFGNRILIKKSKIKEQIKIILEAQYLEISNFIVRLKILHIYMEFKRIVYSFMGVSKIRKTRLETEVYIDNFIYRSL